MFYCCKKVLATVIIRNQGNVQLKEGKSFFCIYIYIHWVFQIKNLNLIETLSVKLANQKVYFYLWFKLTQRWIDIGAWDFHWVISYLYLTTSLYFQHINLIFYMSFGFLKNKKKRKWAFSPSVSDSYSFYYYYYLNPFSSLTVIQWTAATNLVEIVHMVLFYSTKEVDKYLSGSSIYFSFSSNSFLVVMALSKSLTAFVILSSFVP